MPDSMESLPIGQITNGIQHNTLITTTVTHIYKSLPIWRDNPNRNKTEQSEDRLSSDLCKYLNFNHSMVKFNFQEPQPENRSVDLSVTPSAELVYMDARLFTYNMPILYIEAKRLPAPPPANRKYEYVTGISKKSGGIQRFKLGLHAVEHNTTVIIGYIQKHTCQDWLQIINTWISDLVAGNLQDSCIWNNTEKLQGYTEDIKQGIARSESRHSRSTSPQEILTYHLWIDMNHHNASSACSPDGTNPS